MIDLALALPISDQPSVYADCVFVKEPTMNLRIIAMCLAFFAAPRWQIRELIRSRKSAGITIHANQIRRGDPWRT